MAEVTRITVGKNDEATIVAEQLIDADTTSIIFVIPKGSVFSQSLNNFKLLKREGDVLGKEIIIESEDPAVQERAVKAGLEIGETAPSGGEEEAAPSAPAERSFSGRLPRGRSLRVKAAPEEDEDEPVRKLARTKKKAAPIEAEDVVDADVPPISESPLSQRGEPVRPAKVRGNFWSVRRAVRVLITLGIIAGILYVGLGILPEATIDLTAKKDTWSYNGVVTVDKGITKLDVASAKIPGQVFTQKNSATIKQKASGNQFVERKATGTLTVYNAYSSQPQSIVANTRFVTSAGVVFRITKALVIPGAKIENGGIIPSSVVAEVVADKAGIASNLGPTSHLNIPGFAKTPKYQGFYGDLKDGSSGGFSGQTRIATEADIKAAKAASEKAAEALVRGQIDGLIPEGFKTVDSATRFTVNKQTVNPIADADGNFSVVTDAQLSVFAFREQDVKEFLIARMTAEKKGYKVDTEELKYTGGTQSTASTGRISLTIAYKADISYVLDIESLRAAIAGKKKSELSAIIGGVEGLEKGNVKLWPFYVQKVTSNLEKITIVVQ
jgi:hypothetical protein